MSLQRTFDLYRHAYVVARDEKLDQHTRDAALDDAFRLRGELDQALIERTNPAGVSENAAARISGGFREVSDAAEEAELKALFDPENSKRKMQFNWPTEQRADAIWSKDSSVGSVLAGNTVPTSVLDRVVYHLNAQSAIYPFAYKLITSDGRDMKVPVLTSDATANQTAEKTAATLTSPVFAGQTFKAWRQDLYMVLSAELMRDSAVNMTQIVGDVAGRAIATKCASVWATGAGTTVPQGLSVGATSALTTASPTSVTADEVLSLYYALVPQARKNACWIVSSDAMTKLAKLKDDDGRYLLSPALSLTQVDTLLGEPIGEDPAMPNMTAGLVPIVFGDLADYFWIRLVQGGQNSGEGGIVIELSDQVYFTSFEVVCRAAVWTDSAVLATTAGEIQSITQHA
jgi:HK97 family phage major capsid protein